MTFEKVLVMFDEMMINQAAMLYALQKKIKIRHGKMPSQKTFSDGTATAIDA